MMKPNIDINDATSGETITREMTDEEDADLLAMGWQENNPNDEVSE